MQSWAGYQSVMGKPTPWSQFSCLMSLVQGWCFPLAVLKCRPKRMGMPWSEKQIWITSQNFVGYFFLLLLFGGRRGVGTKKTSCSNSNTKRGRWRRYLLTEKSLLHCSHYITERSDPIRTPVISIHFLMKAYLRTVEELVTDPSPTIALCFWQTLKLIGFFT